VNLGNGDPSVTGSVGGSKNVHFRRDYAMAHFQYLSSLIQTKLTLAVSLTLYHARLCSSLSVSKSLSDLT